MRVTVDEAGGAACGLGLADGAAEWLAALQEQGQGQRDEIRGMQSGRLAALFGSAWLGFCARGADVFHASQATPCGPRGVKLTATLSDVSPWLMPQLIAPARAKAARLFAERILERADGCIAVSDAVRQSAIQLLGLKPEKVTTIYPGVRKDFFDAAPLRRERPYVVAIQGEEPRTNLFAVREAWLLLKPELREGFELVIAGAAAEALTPELLAGAILLVHVPLYEGFAMPVAQAMAAQIAVVTSDSSSMPEVGRDAALMVDPHSVSEIAGAITRLLEADGERAKLARYGRARAEKYRWEKCAAESLAFFHRVHEA